MCAALKSSTRKEICVPLPAVDGRGRTGSKLGAGVRGEAMDGAEWGCHAVEEADWYLPPPRRWPPPLCPAPASDLEPVESMGATAVKLRRGDEEAAGAAGIATVRSSSISPLQHRESHMQAKPPNRSSLESAGVV
jgi:hypothetical protein